MMIFRSFDTSAPSSGCAGSDKGVLDNAITVMMSGRFKLSRITSFPTNPVAPATISFMVALTELCFVSIAEVLSSKF